MNNNRCAAYFAQQKMCPADIRLEGGNQPEHLCKTEGESVYNEKVFSEEELKSILEWLKNKITEAKDSKISIKEALEVSLEIEEKVSESSYYKAFQPRKKSMEDFIKGVIDSTERHRNKVKEELDKVN